MTACHMASKELSETTPYLSHTNCINISAVTLNYKTKKQLYAVVQRF